MSKRPKPPTTFLVRMPPALHAQVRARAAVEDRSMAAVARAALRAYVESPTTS